LPIHVGKYQGADLDARAGKRLGSHHAYRVGPIPDVGEELVELGLNGALKSREQEGQEGWKAEGAIPGEKLGLEACVLKQFSRKQVLGEIV
jgi:hypothetical protein